MTKNDGTNPNRGDAGARRRSVLEAAAELLDEGGYAALTNRAVAKRAGMSPGLIYQYFADKQDIFVTLLHESQIALIDVIRALPRDEGVAGLLEALMPESTQQWIRVGHLAGTWHDNDGGFEERQAFWNLRESTERQFAELRRALEEAAEAQGVELRDHPALIQFVWSGLMGLADTLMNNWAEDVEEQAFIAYSTEALARAITI